MKNNGVNNKRYYGLKLSLSSCFAILSDGLRETSRHATARRQRFVRRWLGIKKRNAFVHINTYILFFFFACCIHTINSTMLRVSSRYGILENFHYPLLQLLFDILFRHISSTSCICVSYTRIVQEGRGGGKKEKKIERTI